MVEYTHWLVTNGREPFQDRRRSFTPLVLAAKAECSMQALRRRVVAHLDAVATCLMIGTVSEFAKLAALSNASTVQHYSNLWLREVRIGPEGNAAKIDLEREVAVCWTLSSSGRLPGPWQGPADGVIPERTPVTIFDESVPPSKFEVIE